MRSYHSYIKGKQSQNVRATRAVRVISQVREPKFRMVEEPVQDVTAGMGQIRMLLLRAHLPPLISGPPLHGDNFLLLLLN